MITILQDPASPANYSRWTGAIPHETLCIVIHVMDGTFAGTSAWFKNPQAQVSSNYGISRTGAISQYVPEADVAWAQGIPFGTAWVDQAKNPLPGVNPNQFCVSIEHEGDATTPWPEAQVQASAELVADISKRHSIPCDRNHVVGHHEIYAGHICPGSGCPLDEIVQRAAAIAAP